MQMQAPGVSHFNMLAAARNLCARGMVSVDGVGVLNAAAVGYFASSDMGPFVASRDRVRVRVRVLGVDGTRRCGLPRIYLER